MKQGHVTIFDILKVFSISFRSLVATCDKGLKTLLCKGSEPIYAEVNTQGPGLGTWLGSDISEITIFCACMEIKLCKVDSSVCFISLNKKK